MEIDNFREMADKLCDGEYFRKSKEKDHQSCFELWDTVYVMYENQVVEARICEINIQIVPMPTTTDLTRVKYRLTRLNRKEVNSHNYTDFFAEVEEGACFASKEELLQSL